MRVRSRGVVAVRALLVAALLAAGPVLSACGEAGGLAAQPGASGVTGGVPAGSKIGVLLPDVQSSTRWEQADKPFLAQAFTAAGVDFDIQNAQGDKRKFLSLADDMITEGVGVLMIAALDRDSGLEVIRRAASAGIPVIDYDRLTLGGGAKYYVSFDNVAVGTQMGQAVVRTLQARGKQRGGVVELNGSPSDNNAAQLQRGYDKVIRDAGYTVLESRAVDDWDEKMAGTAFREIYDKHGDQIDAVVAANDGLGGAAASVLAEHGRAGKVPVTGQDATDAALQRLLLGTQTMTVYKAIKLEADAAAKLAISMIKGDAAGADAQASGSIQHAESGTFVKAVLLKPRSITADTVKDVVADGFTTAGRVCTTGALRAACARHGVG
jgi:D-xylose transport system substrate-binding protein